MSNEKKGIQETKDIIAAAKVIGVEIARLAKDGVGFSDVTALLAALSSGPNAAALMNAYNGAKDAGAELQDLDLDEIQELVAAGSDLGFSIVKALKD